MIRYLFFELGKIWRKRSFLLSVCLLLLINLFLLWYTSLPGESTPALSAYKTFRANTAGMTEQEKTDYIAHLKETMDGIRFVQDILFMQNLSGELGTALTEQSLQSNPGIFETYYDLYQSGDYIIFTDSLSQEQAFIEELYAEGTKVAGYENYLKSVQDNKNTLNGISVFKNQNTDSFASRNIEKSAADYASLNAGAIRFTPSKPITASMESLWTDLLLLLSVFLFVGGLIMEEKEKQLFYITRSARYGIIHCILAKLSALLFHCLVITTIFYSANVVFFVIAAGGYDMMACLQSVAPYMESGLSISILGYILLSILTKGLILFGIGAVLTALSILSDQMLMPYLICIALCAASQILYTAIPPVSVLNPFKYLNLMGLLRTENLYGAYLNFNVFGYPVSRLILSWGMIVFLIMSGTAASCLLFIKGSHLQLKKNAGRFTIPFHPHGNLLRHEGYKILIRNHALPILILFGILICRQETARHYSPSVYEQYYQDMMLQLEGYLTEEKAALIQSEHDRYEEAFEQIDRIDEMVARGELSQMAGDTMKSKWYPVTAFYPSFERIESQYEWIKENGGTFLYDTGYLYLFGTKDHALLTDLLLLTICLISAFGNTIPMEYQRDAWAYLSATLRGRYSIVRCKAVICAASAALLTILPFLCRYISISAIYPLHGLGFSVRSIPYCHAFAWNIPVGIFLVLLLLAQLAATWLITGVILACSKWRKNHIQTIFFCVLILVIPLVFQVLGFTFTAGYSVYPLYSWISHL